MKQTTVFFCSPHPKGFTFKLLESFLGNLKNINFIDVYSKKILPCIDCKSCKCFGKCCLSDDICEIYRAFENDDILIFATPVYYFSFPSPMKSILDRSQKYFSNRIINVSNRISFIVATCGSEKEFGITVLEKQIKMLSSLIGVDFLGCLFLSGTDKINSFLN
ncbi:MAG: flavodoxin family protein [Oscillospiraceae bacterium]|jgi:multimeric flavodoxin WrbA|nr:flavodoxin family protein [Oscillospiraceae bacterium]